MKKRLGIVTGVIVVVIIVVLALVGGSTSAKTITIAEAVTGNLGDARVQVSGQVVPNSYHTTGNTLTFAIYDAEDKSEELQVSFDGGVAATFGNEVTAICTGKMKEDGVLYASELVTKCPSKYESATDALGVLQLLDYGAGIYDKPVKVTGLIKEGTMKPAGQGDRFILLEEVDPLLSRNPAELAIVYEEALPDAMGDGSSVVLTGSLTSNGKFNATDVALEG